MPIKTSADQLKKIRARCEKAYLNSNDWRARVDELYDFALPQRAPMHRFNADANRRRRNTAHDSTAAKAAVRFAGRMARDLTPAFQPFFEIKLGAASKAALFAAAGENAAEVENQINQRLETIALQVQAMFERSQFAVASEEMYLDLFGGQGALLALEDEDEIIDFMAVASGQIALLEDGRGRVKGVYWKKTHMAGDLPDLWPNAEFDRELREKIKDNPEQDIGIVEATEFNAKTRRWNFYVYEDQRTDQGPFWEVLETRTSPWITPRFYKVPGEAMGRGPGLLALPTIKTLDKVTELTLKAAAFAVLGLWMYRNDRAFNPRTARMTPGGFWKVAATGGQMGSTIQKLDVPGRFDVSNLILQDLREQVKQITFDDTLPPDSGAVRSPTEILERLNRLQRDLSGAFARQILEVVVPLVKRTIDVLERRDLINLEGLEIDGLALKIEVTSTIAKAQSAQDVTQVVEWLQIMLATGGQEAMMLVADIEKVYVGIAQKLGVPSDWVRQNADRADIQKMVAGIIAARQPQAQPPTQQEAVAPAEAAA